MIFSALETIRDCNERTDRMDAGKQPAPRLGITSGGSRIYKRGAKRGAKGAVAEVERHRRDDRGLWGGGVPTGGRVWRGGDPPPQKKMNFGSQNGDFRSILDSIFLQFSYLV